MSDIKSEIEKQIRVPSKSGWTRELNLGCWIWERRCCWQVAGG
jgi:hypothetical protein